MKDGHPGRETIAIAGAGIAGLSAAIALKLAGFPVEIFERETTLEPVGAGIQMGPNATRIMERWELDLLGAAVEPEAIELRNAITGALLNTIPLRRAARKRYGAPHVTLMRADLQRALLTRAQELEIPVAFDAPIRQVSQNGEGVTIEAGSMSASAAALIGADGIKSSVRELAGFHPRRYSAQSVAWRAMLPLSAVAAPMQSIITVWMAPGAHLVHYPVSGGASVNAVLAIDDIYQSDGGNIDGSVLDYLLDRLSGWAGQPLASIASTEAWLRWRMFGIEKWHGGEGRIQLIGDAWHAMVPHLGSGGVMAVEDGAALAECLSGARSDIVQGLNDFRKKRERRVWKVANASAQMGRIYHVGQPFDIARNLTIKASSGPALLKWNDWLYGVQREGLPRAS
ncbi:MAG: FAD-dependent monooxygenase [Rhodomicrobium sp.]